MKISISRERADHFLLGLLVGGLVGAIATNFVRRTGYFVLKHEIDGLDIVKIGVAIAGAFWLQVVFSRREDRDKKHRDFVLDEVKVSRDLLHEICSDFKKSCAADDKSEFNSKVQRLGMTFSALSRNCEQMGAEGMGEDVFLKFRQAATDDKPFSAEREVALSQTATALRVALNDAAFRV